MKIHLIQHALWDLHTHYYQETIAWKSAITQMGLRWNGYTNSALSPNLVELLGVNPCFPFPPDAAIDQDPVSRDVTDLLYLSDRFAQAMGALVENGLHRDDIVIIPFCTYREVYGVARWLATLPKERHPRFAMIFHMPDFEWTISKDRTSVTGNFSLWRFAANQLRQSIPDDRVFFGALDARLATYLKTGMQYPVHTVPIINLYIPRVMALPASEKMFDVVIAGEFRPEKGSTLVLSLMELLGNARPALRLALQVSTEAVASEVRAFIAARGGSLNLDIAVGELTQLEFATRLATSRLAIMPYDPSRYAVRNSGVCSEAFGYGIPVVAPDNTWLSDRVRDGSGTGTIFRTWTPASICAATLEGLDAMSILTTLAQNRAAAWRDGHDATSALNQILDVFAPRKNSDRVVPGTMLNIATPS